MEGVWGEARGGSELRRSEKKEPGRLALLRVDPAPGSKLNTLCR